MLSSYDKINKLGMKQQLPGGRVDELMKVFPMYQHLINIKSRDKQMIRGIAKAFHIAKSKIHKPLTNKLFLRKT